MNKRIKKKKRRKLKSGIKLFLVLIIFIITYLAIYFFNFFVKNIYIVDNTVLTDKQVLDIINYSEIKKTTVFSIKNKLEDNEYILSVRIKKKNLFRDLYITIEENKPIFSYNNKTILSNNESVKESFIVPILVNEVPKQFYDKFINKLNSTSKQILTRISEIKYYPNSSDNKRFLLTMSDGNYVYLTLNRFEYINDYLEIVANFNNQKGILYLDTGKYFEVIE